MWRRGTALDCLVVIAIGVTHVSRTNYCRTRPASVRFLALVLSLAPAWTLCLCLRLQTPLKILAGHAKSCTFLVHNGGKHVGNAKYLQNDTFLVVSPELATMELLLPETLIPPDLSPYSRIFPRPPRKHEIQISPVSTLRKPRIIPHYESFHDGSRTYEQGLNIRL